MYTIMRKGQDKPSEVTIVRDVIRVKSVRSHSEGDDIAYIRTVRAKYMPKAHLTLVTPAIVKRTVTPTRPPNADLRTREHLTEAEVERLMDAARKNRWGHRDATMVLVAYRHGFRPAELVDLRWDQIDFASGVLHIRRVKCQCRIKCAQMCRSKNPQLGGFCR
jgi:integrase